jgi:hypothetical protein
MCLRVYVKGGGLGGREEGDGHATTENKHISVFGFGFARFGARVLLTNAAGQNNQTHDKVKSFHPESKWSKSRKRRINAPARRDERFG